MDGVLDEAPPSRHRHVASPRRGVDTLDREVLVVAKDRRHRRPELLADEQVPQGAEHRGGAQHQADLGRDPGVVHDGGQGLARRPGRGRAASRRTPRTHGAAAASTTAPWAAVGVHTHTASQRSSTAATLASTSAPFTAANPSARSASRSWTATTAASTTPARIMACRPMAWAQAITPVPTNPILTTVLQTTLPMMDRDELLAAGDHNLASTMRLYATTAPGAMLEDDGRLLLYSTSATWPGPYHNGAMRLDRSLAPDEVLARAAAFFVVAPRLLRVGRGARRYRPGIERARRRVRRHLGAGAPRLAIEHRLDPGRGTGRRHARRGHRRRGPARLPGRDRRGLRRRLPPPRRGRSTIRDHAAPRVLRMCAPWWRARTGDRCRPPWWWRRGRWPGSSWSGRSPAPGAAASGSCARAGPWGPVSTSAPGPSCSRHPRRASPCTSGSDSSRCRATAGATGRPRHVGAPRECATDPTTTQGRTTMSDDRRRSRRTRGRERRRQGAGARAHLPSYRRRRRHLATGEGGAQRRRFGVVGVGEVARLLARSPVPVALRQVGPRRGGAAPRPLQPARPVRHRG